MSIGAALKLLWEFKWAIAIALLLAALGVQTYRLQGAASERDLLALEKSDRIARDGMRDAANHRNKERTDEEYSAASRRAAAARVRGKPAAGIVANAPAAAGSGDSATVCLDRERLDREIAGWVERHAARLGEAIAEVSRLNDERLTAVAREGEAVAAAARACAAWALSVQ